jgi:CRP-like cAMP-binding protein
MKGMARELHPSNSAGRDHEKLFERVKTYGSLSSTSQKLWQQLLRSHSYRKGERFIHLDEVPLRVGFVVEGLFSQEFTSESGDSTIKYFFPEGRFAASVGAMLTGSPSLFSIVALEDSKVLSYDFASFKTLTEQHLDIAAFYIRYMERHWIVEKEPLEVSFRHDTARTRYQNFLKTYPGLTARLKKHQIASYLGITPTQLSRLLPSTR